MMAPTISPSLKLIGFSVTLLITWLVLLPHLGESTIIKQWIKPLQEQRINPSGMYYTDVFE